jgi:hypothetical protein
MSAKTQITADFATPNDVASRLRVSAARAAELRRQVFDLQARKADEPIVLVSLKAPRETSSRKNMKSMSIRASRSKKK